MHSSRALSWVLVLGMAGVACGGDDTSGAAPGASGSAGSASGSAGSLGSGGSSGAAGSASQGGSAGSGGSAGDVGQGGSSGSGGSSSGADASIDGSFDASTNVGTGTPGDTGVVGDGRAEATVDAGPGSCSGPCNALANIGTVISRTVVAGAPPAMTGGTIVDGTYLLTAIVHYNNDNSAITVKQTAVIAGNTETWVESLNGGADIRATGTFTLSNNHFNLMLCCPSVVSASALYTADGATLQSFDPTNANRLLTYTKQ